MLFRSYNTDVANANARLSSQLQYIFATSRIAHFMKAIMRDKVGIYAEAGYPAYKDGNGDGYPDDVNVSKRLAVFIGNYPDRYETYRPKMDGPFVPSVKDEKGHYIANAAYKDVPGAQLRIGNLPRTESTGVHSIDDLVVGARGPHADAFRGFMNSTEVFRIMSEALALGNK